MGQQDLQVMGYPRSNLKSDFTYSFYCGGRGGGACAVLLTQSKVQFAIDVNPFLTRNRLLTIKNSDFEVAADGGPDGIACSHTIGTMQQCYIAFSASSGLTAAQIVAQNNRFTPALNQVLEFTQFKLPQPTDAGWANKIWITLYWGAASVYYGDVDYADNSQYFTILKHDFDVRQ